MFVLLLKSFLVYKKALIAIFLFKRFIMDNPSKTFTNIKVMIIVLLKSLRNCKKGNFMLKTN